MNLKQTTKLFCTTLLLFALSGTPLFASEVKQVEKDTQSMITDVVEILKVQVPDKTTRHPKILARIKSHFDFKKMAKLSLGRKYWKKFSKVERKAYLKASIQKMKKTYLGKLDLYTDEKIQFGLTKKVKKKIEVQVMLKTAQDSTEMIYKLYKSKKRGWRIYDVEIEGVSVLKTYHSQFNGILNDKGAEGGYQGLMSSLQVK